MRTEGFNREWWTVFLWTMGWNMFLFEAGTKLGWLFHGS
jgi:hypothetical protein